MSETIFEPGDTVLIKPHTTGPLLYPDIRYPHPGAGLEYVIERQETARWIYDTDRKCHLRRLKEDGLDIDDQRVHPGHLELVKKGPGAYTPGVSVPFSQRELSDQRTAAFRQKFLDTPVPTHEGFVNAATYLAWLYLNNDSGFMGTVASLRRMDGTINPNKIEKEFKYLQAAGGRLGAGAAHRSATGIQRLLAARRRPLEGQVARGRGSIQSRHIS
ncbi:hypothetical protein LP414_27545 [Polaromonas sp. P1(28)-13]|nr:hypothetical protein LP414_27545 [Polaromonas sp. P1(28)-13]